MIIYPPRGSDPVSDLKQTSINDPQWCKYFEFKGIDSIDVYVFTKPDMLIVVSRGLGAHLYSVAYHEIGIGIYNILSPCSIHRVVLTLVNRAAADFVIDYLQ